MKASSIGFLAAFCATLPSALAADLSSFFLVTYDKTSAPPAKTNDDSIVSCTSLFDPNYQVAYLLRLIKPGYNSLPQFNITSGTLQTLSDGPHSGGAIHPYLYNTTAIRNNGTAQQLQFMPDPEPAGKLAIDDGLLTVEGEKKGWSICDGPLNEKVLWWQGNDTSCKDTYLHAVSKAPY